MSDFSDTVLVIIGQSPLSGHHLYEALSAVMVLATYGQSVQLVFIGDAVACLQPVQSRHPSSPQTQQPFKSTQALVESFEFYDLLPIWVANQPTPTTSVVECVAVTLEQINTEKFKAVLTW